jgi:cardiolipin synthase
MPHQPPQFQNSWQSEQLISDADSYYQSVCDDIHQAQHSVILESYIFNRDQVGQQLIYALTEASRRGVTVRVLIDGIGSLASAASIAEQLDQAGIDARIYHPPPWYLRAYQWSLEKGSRVRKLLLFFLAINRRNHRKLVIIDDHIAWVGSFNVSQCHLTTAQGGKNWRDYAVRVTGKGVQRLTENFQQLWAPQLHQRPKGFLRYYLSNLSKLSRRLKKRYLLRSINQAQRRLWICSAYFAPYGSLVRAIKKACHRGLDVRLLVPARSDVSLFPALTASYYSDLITHGVTVLEYQPYFFHAKVLLIDDKAILGSSNFNHRSLLHDLELDVLIHQQTSIQELETQLLQDMQLSRAVTIEELPRYRKLLLLSWIPRLIRYWM